MTSVDKRVVEMDFENTKFRNAAKDTKKSLDDVNRAVESAGKGKGLLSLDANAQRVSTSFSKMSVITTTALATITSKAVSSGINLAKSLAVSPVLDGWREYESSLTKQNVIMNATGATGKRVKQVLGELNEYSDKTIYSFGNMTDSVQKFVNAGVPLGTSVTSIKGIANAAAFAGASASEADRAMYAFSQAMSLGFVGLQDWNQIENANMGTIQFKNELLNAAVAAGTLTKKGKEYVTASGKTISATKGWRDGLQEQWATTEVLNKALGKYADENTKLGRKAFDSAQKVRTFTAFMDTLKESMGSGWASVFGALMGGLRDATKFWTGLSNAVGGANEKFFGFLTTALKTWRSMGGFQKILGGIKNILSPIAALFSAVGDAFSQAFPSGGSKGAGKTLYAMSAGFEAITRPVQLLASLIRGTTPVIKAFFDIISIIGSVLGRIGGRIGDLVSGLGGLASVRIPSGGGILGFIKDVAKAVGDAISGVSELMRKGQSLTQAFGSVSIDMPSLPSMPSMPKIGSMFSSGSDDGGKLLAMTSGVKDLTREVFGLNKASDDTKKTTLFGSSGNIDLETLHSMKDGIKSFASSVSGSGPQIESFGVKIKDTFGKIVEGVGKFMKGFTFDDLVSSANLAILGTFVLSITRFMNAMSKSISGFAGIGDSLVGVLDGAGSALNSFQTAANAKLLIAIAIAIGVLAASMILLSMIPADKMKKAMASLAGVFIMVSLALKQITKMVTALDGKGVVVKLGGLSLALLALAAAMLVLAAAFLIMNRVDWQSIVKGLITMFAVMKVVQTLGAVGKTAAKSLVAGAAAIAIISGAMIVLAAALIAFKLVDWESMGKAGVALAAVALAVGLLALIPYEGIAKVGLALLAASVGMIAMATALIMFAAVKWESIGKAGLVLLGLTLALGALMLVGNPVAITGIVSLSAAMVLLAGAMLILNEVEWASIAKITVILLALVLVLGVLLAVLALAAPVIPILMGFALALLALGAALALFAAAMALAMTLGAAGTAAFAAMATGAAVAVAVFMQTLAAEAPILKKAFLDILQTLIDTIVEAVPMVLDGIKRLWTAVKNEMISPDKQKSMGDTAKGWVTKLADGVKAKLPLIVNKAKELIVGFIKGMVGKIPEVVGAAVRLVAGVLQGLAKNLGPVIKAGADIVIKFIQGVGQNAGRVASEAADVVIDFVNSLSRTIETKTPALVGAMTGLGMAMVRGLIDGVTALFSNAMDKITGLAEGMIGKAKSILKIFSPSRVFKSIGKFLVQGLTLGIQNNAAAAISAVASMVSGQIAVANEYVSKFIQQLDQRAIAARAKAQGLAAAAERAQEMASKTKTKKDDKAANKIAKQATRAGKKAKQAESKAESAKKQQDRAVTWKNADSFERAQIKSQDAQQQLESSKSAQRRAAAALVEADALEKQSKAEGLTAKQRKALRKEAKQLREQAERDAKAANTQLANSKKSAAAALEWQKKAGKEAAEAFEKQFKAQAKAAEDDKKFAAMSNEEKAKYKLDEADRLDKQAAENLKKAKAMAYTDLEEANRLAELALKQAEDARAAREAAENYGKDNAENPTTSTPVDLQATEAAALAFQDHENLYDDAYAAAAGDRTVQFIQNNNSPEALSESEIYRQTNNLVKFALTTNTGDL